MNTNNNMLFPICGLPMFRIFLCSCIFLHFFLYRLGHRQIEALSANPDFDLNKPSYSNINILIVGPRFQVLDLNSRPKGVHFTQNSILQVKNQPIPTPRGPNIRKMQLEQKYDASDLLAICWDSRPFRLATYTAVDEKSDVQVNKKQMLESEGQHKKTSHSLNI